MRSEFKSISYKFKKTFRLHSCFYSFSAVTLFSKKSFFRLQTDFYYVFLVLRQSVLLSVCPPCYLNLKTSI